MNPLDAIRIVLVETFHPGNIGSVARAMKTMGLRHLALVNPRNYPDPQAVSMAAGGVDILENACIYPDLASAIAESQCVLGASARLRTFPLPEVTPEQGAKLAITRAQQGHQIAWVFGRERSGLTQEEIALCTHQTRILANPEYEVLNLAQAVQIFCYFLYQEARLYQETNPSISKLSTKTVEYPTQAQMHHLYARIHTLLDQSGFLAHKPEAQTLAKLMAIMQRAELQKKEVNLLHAILSTIEQHKSPTS